MRRRLWLVALGLVVALAGGHFLYWRVVASRLAAGYADWVTAQRAAGWSVASGKPALGGWPMAATLTVDEVALHGMDAALPDGVNWNADHLTLRVALLQPLLLQVIPSGAQSLRVGDAPDVPYTADRLRIEIPLDPGAPPRTASVDAADLRAAMPGGAPAGVTVGLLTGRVSLHPAAGSGEPAVSLTLSAETIGLPSAWPALTAALGSRVSSVSVDASLLGKLPRAPALAARAAAWRDEGGTLEISRAAIGWGPLGVAGSATLALDDQLQVMGTGQAHVVGYVRTLDALGSAGVIGVRGALAAKAVLGLVAHGPDAQADAVDLPLTLQDRTLSLRQIPLLRFPAIDWGAFGGT